MSKTLFAHVMNAFMFIIWLWAAKLRKMHSSKLDNLKKPWNIPQIIIFG